MMCLGVDLTTCAKQTASLRVLDTLQYSVVLSEIVIAGFKLPSVATADAPDAAIKCVLVDPVAQLTRKPQNRGVELVLFGAIRVSNAVSLIITGCVHLQHGCLLRLRHRREIRTVAVFEALQCL